MGAWARFLVWSWSAVAAALLLGACSAGGAERGIAARPAVLGASLSAGAESALRGLDVPDRPDGLVDATIDLAAALDAVIGGAGVGPFIPLADGGLFVAPVASIGTQVDAARSRRATLVVAVDVLFWCVYGPAANETERLDRLERGLAELDRLPAPLLLGDLPDAGDAVGAALGPSSVPHPSTLATAEARIGAWAEERERVRVLALSRLHREVVDGDPARRSSAMADGLHATAEGQLRLAGAVAEALAGAGWLPEGAPIRGEAEARARLAPRAIAPVRDPRREAAAAASRLERLSAARAELDRSRAALEASDPADRAEAERRVTDAVDAVMVADLFSERALLDLPILLSRVPEGSALRGALAERAGGAVLLARSPTASPDELATAIEWLVALDRADEALPLASRLGRLAATEARDRVATRAAAATRAAELLYATSRRRSPSLASALVVDAVAWAEATRAREREAAVTRAAARERGIELRAPTEDGVTVLIGVLEATGRREDAAAVRRAVP